MAYKNKKITFETVLKDKSMDKLTRISKRFEHMTRSVSKLNSHLMRTRAALSPITKRLDLVSKKFRDVGMAVGKGVALVGGAVGGFSLFESANFEAEMNKLEAITKATKQQRQELSDLGEELNRTTQFKGTDALLGMKYLSMSGMKIDQVEKAIKPTIHLTGAAQLNASEGFGLKESADIFSNILTAFKIDRGKEADTADKLAYAFSNANMDLEELGMALRNLAPLAKTAGVSFEDSVALLMSLSGSGIKGELAGTAVAGSFSRLLNLTPEAQEILVERHDLKKEEREKFIGDDGKIKDFVAFLAFMERKEIKIGEVMKILGQESGKYLVGQIKNHQDIRTLANKINNKQIYQGTAERLNDVNIKGFWGSIKLLTSSLSAFAKKLGDNLLLEKLTNLTKKIKEIFDWLNELDPKYIKLIGTITAAIAGFVALSLGVAAITAALKVLTLGLGPLIYIGSKIAGLGALLTSSAAIAPAATVIGTTIMGTELIDYFFDTNTSLITRGKKLFNSISDYFSKPKDRSQIENIRRANKDFNKPKETKLSVEFKNTPLGTKIKAITKAPNTILKTNTGFNMEGAF